jgi:hypothetical protein
MCVLHPLTSDFTFLWWQEQKQRRIVTEQVVCKPWGNLVITVTRQWSGRPVFSSQQRQWRDFFHFATASRPALGPTQPHPMGTRGSFPAGKAAGAWSWPLTSIQCRSQRMCGAIPPLPQYAFRAWHSVKAQVQLYLMHTTQSSSSPRFQISFFPFPFHSSNLHIYFVVCSPFVTAMLLLR